jgi:hypothetical protein
MTYPFLCSPLRYLPALNKMRLVVRKARETRRDFHYSSQRSIENELRGINMYTKVVLRRCSVNTTNFNNMAATRQAQ